MTTIGFFGAGHMAEAIALRISAAMPSTLLSFYSPSGKSAQQLSEKLNGEQVFDKQELLKCEVLFLAFRPQHLHEHREFLATLPEEQLTISLLAGATLSIFSQIGQTNQQNKNWIRWMPNLGSRVGGGVTLYCSQHSDLKTWAKFHEKLLETLGKSYEVLKESDIDFLTALSGSGPAFMSFMMNTFQEILTKRSFFSSDEERASFIFDSFESCLSSWKLSGLTFSSFADQVASKGGVTEQGLRFLESNEKDLYRNCEGLCDRVRNRSEEISTELAAQFNNSPKS